MKFCDGLNDGAVPARFVANSNGLALHRVSFQEFLDSVEYPVVEPTPSFGRAHHANNLGAGRIFESCNGGSGHASINTPNLHGFPARVVSGMELHPLERARARASRCRSARVKRWCTRSCATVAEQVREALGVAENVLGKRNDKDYVNVRVQSPEASWTSRSLLTFALLSARLWPCVLTSSAVCLFEFLCTAGKLLGLACLRAIG